MNTQDSTRIPYPVQGRPTRWSSRGAVDGGISNGREPIAPGILDDVLSSTALRRRTQWAAVIAIVLITGAVRFAAIGSPPIDRTAWKEIDYLQISQGYLQGVAFHRPEVWWPAEPPRATAMEFPLVPFLASLGYRVLGYNALSARIWTLFAFSLLPVYAFLLWREELGPLAGILSAAGCALMPLYHPFGRYLYSEPMTIFFSTAAVYHTARWASCGRWWQWGAAAASFSLAVALKLEPLYLLLPMTWCMLREPGWGCGLRVRFLALLGAAAVLPVIWYAQVYRLGSEFDVFGVLRGHDKFQTVAMLSQGWWYREIGMRLVDLAGRRAVPLAVLGLLVSLRFVFRRHGPGLVLAYLAAVVASIAIVAEGNIDAPYRQLPVVPPLSALVALGSIGAACAMVALARRVIPVRRGNPWGKVTLALALLFAFSPAARRPILGGVRYFDTPVHGSQWRIAEVIRRYAGPGDLLVAAGEYSVHKGGNDLSPVLYHYSGLRGFTVSRRDATAEEVESLRRRGATFFSVSTYAESEMPPAAAALRSRYPVLFEDRERGLLLIDLRKGASPDRIFP